MTLPIFPPGQGPGASFTDLLRHTGQSPPPVVSQAGLSQPGSPTPVELRHGTTIVAVRYAEGVVMAGDRRATEGYTIAHRAMEKVFPADRHSALSIAGAAGPATEMVRLFQTQLEHREKMEGRSLSLEGKANILGQMVRDNLPVVLQAGTGLAWIPIFAGYDVRRSKGRIFTYDITGGRYEEADFHATGSGGRDARTTIKLAWREGLDRATTLELAISGLYEAADEDTATGGPDVVRGIYPTMATVTASGFERVPDEDIAERFGALIQRKKDEGHLP